MNNMIIVFLPIWYLYINSIKIVFLFQILSRQQGEHKARDKDGSQCEQNLPQAKRPHLGKEHVAGTGQWQNLFLSQSHLFPLFLNVIPPFCIFFSNSSPLLPLLSYSFYSISFSRWSRWKRSTSIFALKSTFTRRSFVASLMSWTTHGQKCLKKQNKYWYPPETRLALKNMYFIWC